MLCLRAAGRGGRRRRQYRRRYEQHRDCSERACATSAVFGASTPEWASEDGLTWLVPNARMQAIKARSPLGKLRVDCLAGERHHNKVRSASRGVWDRSAELLTLATSWTIRSSIPAALLSMACRSRRAYCSWPSLPPREQESLTCSDLGLVEHQFDFQAVRSTSDQSAIRGRRWPAGGLRRGGAGGGGAELGGRAADELGGGSTATLA